MKLLYFFKEWFLYVCGKIIFWVAGWKIDVQLPKNIRKCVMIAAPHTSNWDLVFTSAAFAVMRLPVRFTIKKEWQRTPLWPILWLLGALPIDRRPKDLQSKPRNMVEVMVELFENRKELTVLVTPEGTRSLSTKWKTGFYHVAKTAGVPIALGYLDYAKKTAGVGKVIFLTEMYEDLRQIMAFYQNIAPKFPDKFSIDLEYKP